MHGKEFYRNEVERLRSDFCFRELKPVKKSGNFIFLDGKKYLNLNSNDYLSMAGDEKIRRDFLAQFDGALGSTSSRLLCGNDGVYSELEALLAGLFGKSALIFNSGYHANIGVVSGLMTKGDVIFSDKLNHASIIDGIKLSGAEFFRYKHLDYEHLRTLLQKHRGAYKKALIVTESLFSMDGDVCNFEKLVELKKEFDCLLMVDEAHAFGCFGPNGLGICEGVEGIDIVTATFGKAVGSVGAFCIADECIIEYLQNKSRSLIFSTALPEINIAFSKYVIENIFPNISDRRANLFETSKQFNEKLKHSYHLSPITYHSYIIPIILGENQKAIQASQKLMEMGFYLLPIRHPTVPLNTARLRVSLTSSIKFEQLEPILDMFGV